MRWAFALLAVAAVVASTSCGQTRTVTHTRLVRPCSTAARMTACVTDIARATLVNEQEPQQPLNVRCKQGGPNGYLCLTLMRDEYGEIVCVTFVTGELHDTGVAFVWNGYAERMRACRRAWPQS